MIKYYNFIFFFLILNHIISQNPNYTYEADYEVSWQTDSLNTNSIIKLENYKLFFNSYNSLFIAENRLALDTLIFSKDVKSNSFSDLMFMPKPSSNKRIFNTNSDTLNIINEVRGKLYRYNDFVNLNWKITNEADTISDIIVKKATTSFRGRNYIAYFNEDIAVPFGPYKFFGLPGLIVKIYDDKDHIRFNLVKLQNMNKRLNLEYTDEVTEITRKDFIKALESYKTNPIPFMESQGAVFTEETKRIIKERFRKKKEKTNNPIELTYE